MICLCSIQCRNVTRWHTQACSSPSLWLQLPLLPQHPQTIVKLCEYFSPHRSIASYVHWTSSHSQHLRLLSAPRWFHGVSYCPRYRKWCKLAQLRVISHHQSAMPLSYFSINSQKQAFMQTYPPHESVLVDTSGAWLHWSVYCTRRFGGLVRCALIAPNLWICYSWWLHWSAYVRFGGVC